MVPLPSTYDNRLIKYLHINSIFKKGMFLKVKGRGGKFNRPVQGWGSTCRFGARSEGGQRVRSINRIAPQGSHHYSQRGHDTIVLHCLRRVVCFRISTPPTHTAKVCRGYCTTTTMPYSVFSCMGPLTSHPSSTMLPGKYSGFVLQVCNRLKQEWLLTFCSVVLEHDKGDYPPDMLVLSCPDK